LENIANNTLIGAMNADNGKVNSAINALTREASGRAKLRLFVVNLFLFLLFRKTPFLRWASNTRQAMYHGL
jgi:hypothetical protein